MSKEKRINTKEDVWGVYDIHLNKRTNNGLIVARSEERCPVFKDIVPYKSVTVVCNPEDEDDVVYWLTYVHGGECVSMRKELEDGTIALRSNYQCW